MARPKPKKVPPVEYPVLSPWDYLDLAVIHGNTQRRAIALSGFNRGTWHNWLYSRTRCPEKIQREKLEKLHRIATDMGWLKQEVAA